NGNIGPSIWCDGRIVGGWAQRKDGEIVWRLLEEIDPALEDRIAAEAEALAAWHGDVRVTPRFRTPLEKELTA
ncbi:MAG TPA: crosslink repair DNA glycosylase YcaQ family protein, partial [Actinopolymorphaceae bacterium]